MLQLFYGILEFWADRGLSIFLSSSGWVAKGGTTAPAGSGSGAGGGTIGMVGGPGMLSTGAEFTGIVPKGASGSLGR